MSKSLVIFDLDGTLLNTIADLADATNFALRCVGMPPHPVDAYKFMVGNGVDKLLRRAMPSAESNDDKAFEELRQFFYQYYGEHCFDLTEPYPGIRQMLDTLASRDINLAVTSNKYQEAVTKIINHFFPGLPFKAILGKSDFRPAKPDPSIVFEALSIWPTPKSETLYVGDSGVDMATAKRACVDAVGVTWGFRPLSELRAESPEFIISEPDELISIAMK